MASSTIMAVVLENRSDYAPMVQQKLTENGCTIRTRLGLHEGCENKGLILLQLEGADEDVKALERDLTGVPGVRVKSMKIEF